MQMSHGLNIEVIVKIESDRYSRTKRNNWLVSNLMKIYFYQRINCKCS